MTRRSESFFTIGRKLGLVFVVLVALLATVCAVVVLNLISIRDDAGQLLEETREAGISSQLEVEIGVLQSHLSIWHAAGPAVEASVRDRLRAARGLLAELSAGPDDRADPSRAEHQAAESRLISTMLGELDDVEAKLGTDDVAPGQLDRSLRYATVLAAETREEAELANGDLVRRTRTASTVMVVTVLAASLALCAVLWLVRRSVVGPLRALRDRAEQVGKGGAAPAVRLRRSRDEIGSLSRAFEEMTSRVTSTQDALQERVEARTRELMRAARYADIGVLAAGVAHEINNPLASIASCAEGLERRLLSGGIAFDEQVDYLKTIASEAYRARDITGRLLALARHERGAAKPVEIAEIVREVEIITRHQLEVRDVRLEIEVPSRGPMVRGDAGELLQMIVNLVLNARDASPPGGVVRLRVDLVDGDQVEIVVDDAGAGVPDAIAARIFDPFFTTKEVGQGTGLGLALVASIVEAHRGEITVGRSPAHGARFTVRFRAAGAEVG